MPYELFVSLRYLQAKRKQAFISLISFISIGGVAIGVAALIIVLAVMTGFQNDIRDKILGTMAHILIQKPAMTLPEAQSFLPQLQQMPQVASLLPYANGQVLLSSNDNVSSVQMMGVDATNPVSIAHLAAHVNEGTIDGLNERHRNYEDPNGPARDGIVLGIEVARLLGVFIGDEVTVVLPMGRILPTGPVPKLKKMQVIGIISTDFYDYDAGFAYISLPVAQRFFGMGEEISGVEVRLKDVYQTAPISAALKQQFASPFTVQDWTEMNKSLFSAINLEKLAMFLILTLIVLVAAFNIISMLVMMVIEKQGDIATLKCLGATSRSIMQIFMLEGLIIGVFGTVIGAALGVAVSWAGDRYKFIPLDGGSYYLDHLPFTLQASDVVITILSALVICFLSTISPAWQASKLDPVVVFRYE